MVKKVKTVKKTFVNYSNEATEEIKELSKLKILTYSGFYSKKEIQVAIDKPEAIEVRIYNLDNYSKAIYTDFNRKLKKLIK